MNCYPCTNSDTVRPSVGVCLHCGAALCDQHFRESHAYTVGGTTAYGCAHLAAPGKTANARGQ